MRSEQEMMALVLRVAQEDQRIRAVAMNGSRTNPNAPKDPFQDYDIVYLVKEFPSFIKEPQWINHFGDRIIMQTPDDMTLFPSESRDRFAYLLLFTDGNRIDLTLIPFEQKERYCHEDKLTIVLLDKDNALPAIPSPTDREYWVQHPTSTCFSDCCNEFWWVSTYVVKGLWRQEILYAIDHLSIVRAMLLKMLEWKVGIETQFSLSVGKNSKYLERYLDAETWQKLLMTYPSGDYEQVWQALFTMTTLFEQVALEVAERLDLQYSLAEARKVKAHLKHVKTLDPNATAIY
ncbi:aminoglycoside nucleotidyltransferase ANT(6)-Ia [Pullulanibacillus camelliae]|uniref:Aminoglycoside nucleotidyltransferase ANT(6)-Ia n=1 Tax=Pullulanibacillus camelliae TaxID=1707096 RepID=A0A8J2VLI5_9BACL|nr:aminoglycoside 6-adenylyltransferase [Pullulanibacillus camelliae]GGE31502.1 aminoglycoside nucleotidyltransferase ANT(6)-Ia [Pullulanibacillus camelliae]